MNIIMAILMQSRSNMSSLVIKIVFSPQSIWDFNITEEVLYCIRIPEELFLVGTFNLLKPSRTTRFNIKKFYVVPTLRLCVLYGSQNKQQLLPYTLRLQRVKRTIYACNKRWSPHFYLLDLYTYDSHIKIQE
jgi:hypothetical protein